MMHQGTFSVDSAATIAALERRLAEAMAVIRSYDTAAGRLEMPSGETREAGKRVLAGRVHD